MLLIWLAIARYTRNKAISAFAGFCITNLYFDQDWYQQVTQLGEADRNTACRPIPL
jgi:hypothetical protein